MTFHFVPEHFGQLTWFNDSPDAGNTACVCSFCGKLIRDYEHPLRIFRTNNMELRLHRTPCAEQVIEEFQIKAKESRYKFHLGYSKGRYDHADGIRRGQNPYSANGDQVSCLAWWDGWDDEDEEEPWDADDPG